MSTPETNIPGRSRADAVMIELMFRYAILMEAQLMDLQESVRKFVIDMNAAITKLDGMVTEEGRQAQALYESVYQETQQESQVLNDRAAARVDDIISQTLMEMDGSAAAQVADELVAAVADPTPSSLAADASGAKDAVWSKISKKLESVTRLEERLRPQVYKIVQCLNFEDIQTQRLDHLLSGYKLLNEGLMRYLQTGQVNGGDPIAYAQDFLRQIRTQYSMDEERNIFDKVFARKG